MKELEGYRNVVANTKANKEAPHFSGINEEETAQPEKNLTTIQGISQKPKEQEKRSTPKERPRKDKTKSSDSSKQKVSERKKLKT